MPSADGRTCTSTTIATPSSSTHSLILVLATSLAVLVGRLSSPEALVSVRGAGTKTSIVCMMQFAVSPTAGSLANAHALYKGCAFKIIPVFPILKVYMVSDEDLRPIVFCSLPVHTARITGKLTSFCSLAASACNARPRLSPSGAPSSW